MPDREVRTIRDLIYYQYAKIVARSAFSAADGKSAKAQHYGFIKNMFRQLTSGEKSWSDITREDKELVEAERACSYCGALDELHWEHLVPRSVRINERCAACERILGIHNQAWACRSCNSQKGTRGLYDYYRQRFPDEKKFFDLIPPLLEKKYLKTIYNCHRCAATLDAGDIDGDGVITVLDIDAVIRITAGGPGP
jgi:hypothetical protein